MRYNPFDTVEIAIEHKNLAGTLEDITEAYLYLTDPLGVVKVNTLPMIKQSTGKYSYFYTIPLGSVSGWWPIIVLVTDINTYTYSKIGGFNL
jgi:uncharacterized protein YfaS (alpha-2-macroglobulin family)